MVRTVEEARRAVVDEPKRWKVAVVEGASFPLLDGQDTKVWLFRTKKAASEELRDREKSLVADGFKRAMGGLGRGFIVLARGDTRVGLGLDYAGRLSA